MALKFGPSEAMRAQMREKNIAVLERVQERVLGRLFNGIPQVEMGAADKRLLNLKVRLTKDQLGRLHDQCAKELADPDSVKDFDARRIVESRLEMFGPRALAIHISFALLEQHRKLAGDVLWGRALRSSAEKDVFTLYRKSLENGVIPTHLA